MGFHKIFGEKTVIFAFQVLGIFWAIHEYIIQYKNPTLC